MTVPGDVGYEVEKLVWGRLWLLAREPVVSVTVRYSLASSQSSSETQSSRKAYQCITIPQHWHFPASLISIQSIAIILPLLSLPSLLMAPKKNLIHFLMPNGNSTFPQAKLACALRDIFLPPMPMYLYHIFNTNQIESRLPFIWINIFFPFNQITSFQGAVTILDAQNWNSIKQSSFSLPVPHPHYVPFFPLTVKRDHIERD